MVEHRADRRRSGGGGRADACAGAGPALPGDARCPSCGSRLRGCWRGYLRAVRLCRRVERLRIARTLCGGCGQTHALLPSFLLPHRLDAVAQIGEAIEQASAGHGHRPIAARLRLPETTVREWLRRARAGAGVSSARLWRLVQALGEEAPRPPPGERSLAALVRAAKTAFACAARRFGETALPGLWGFVCAVTGGALLAHTDSP